MELRSIPARYQTPAAALFILLLSAAWLTAWGWKHQSVGAVLDRETLRAVAIATSVANSLQPRGTPDQPKDNSVAGQEKESYQLADIYELQVKRQAQGQRIAKVQVLNGLGRILYSSDRSEIGSLVADDDHLRLALQGDSIAIPVSDLSGRLNSASAYEANYIRALAAVSPLESGGKAMGVAVYTSIVEPMIKVRDEAHSILAIANLAGLTVFGVALVILRRAEEAQRKKDSVTGLPRRELAIAAMAAKYPAKSGQKIGWVTVSLQRLRQVTAAYGHETVDNIMRQSAQRLAALSSMDGQIFRLGGEAFAIPVEQNSGRSASEAAASLAQRTFGLFEPAFVCDKHSLVIDVAVGIAIDTADNVSAEGLLNHAEVAMAEANRRGGNQWQQYVPGLEQVVRDRLQSLGSLHEALEKEQFSLAYQPLVDAASQEWLGCEALLRWKHPLKGVILPDNFVPLSEESGLIVEVGQFVLREACHQIAKWRTSLNAEMKVSINLSARQFADPHLLETIRTALEETQLPASALIFEVTESCLALDTDHAVSLLSELRRWGSAIAVDDFGVGYSSLSALRQLPVDILKIDRSFISRVPDDPVDAAIAHAIAALAHGLGLILVAEGVETPAQAKFVREIGCDKLQGFLYSRPLNPRDFEMAYGELASARSGDARHAYGT